MTIVWMLYVLLVGALLALGARAVASALGLAGRSTRWVWATALIGIAALAAVAPRQRSVDIAAMDAGRAHTESVAPIADASRGAGLVAMLDAARTTVALTAVRAIAAANARIPAALAGPAAFGWAFVSTVMLAVYVLVNLRLGRARRRWPRERVQGIPVRIAPAAGPAVIGMVRADIVIPRSLLDRSEDEQRLIIQHEHEHLRARDHVLLALACLAVIVLPWHPAVWYVLARLRLAIELDCDARVLRRGAPARSYGELLIDMAAHGAGIRVGTLALADRPSHLERRLLAMRAKRTRFVLVRAGALCAVAGLLTMAACEAKIPTSAELASMDLAGAEKAAASSGAFMVSDLDNADYFLNGEKMSRELLAKLEGEQIASMTVVKGKGTDGRDTIFVVTKDKLQVLVDSMSTMGMKVRRAGTVTVSDGGQALQRMRRDPGAKQPAIMIDGKLSSESALAALKEDDIQSVSIMKPKQAVAGDPYPDGLLAVETKAYAKAHSKIRMRSGSDIADPAAPSGAMQLLPKRTRSQ
jgi:beta-lactamase regulating signal transducer with metallopeptidase domain